MASAITARANSKKYGYKKKSAYCQFALTYLNAVPDTTRLRKAKDDLARRSIIGFARSAKTISSHSSSSYTVSTCQLDARVVTVHRAFECSDCGMRSEAADLTFHVRANVPN